MTVSFGGLRLGAHAARYIFVDEAGTSAPQAITIVAEAIATPMNTLCPPKGDAEKSILSKCRIFGERPKVPETPDKLLGHEIFELRG